MITNEVNAKYDASYRNSDNTNKLLGRSLTLGQACGLIGVALYGADIPLEDSGSFFAIIYCLFNIFCIFCIFQFTLFIFILWQNTVIAWSFLNELHIMRWSMRNSKKSCLVTMSQFSELMSVVCSGRPAVSGSLSCQLRPGRYFRMTFFIQQLSIQSCRLILAWVSKSAFSTSMLLLYFNLSYITYLTYYAYFPYSVGLVRATSIFALRLFPRPRWTLLNEALKGLWRVTTMTSCCTAQSVICDASTEPCPTLMMAKKLSTCSLLMESPGTYFAYFAYFAY